MHSRRGQKKIHDGIHLGVILKKFTGWQYRVNIHDDLHWGVIFEMPTTWKQIIFHDMHPGFIPRFIRNESRAKFHNIMLLGIILKILMR